MPLFWLLIAILHFTCDVIALSFLGRESDLLFTSIYYLGWFYWIPLSILVRKLGARFPIKEDSLVRALAVHALLAFVVVAIHQVLDFLTIYSLKAFFYPDKLGFPFYHISYTSFIHFIVYFFVLGVNLSTQYFKKFQMEMLRAQALKSKLAQAQVQTLKMQIHPHFLFNTHNAIISLMNNNRNAEAINMLSKLSDLLRYTLEQTERQFVKLSDEIRYIEMYLDIQQVRFKDRLMVNYEIEPSTLEFSVPNFILQPLVENAIKHGIEPYSLSGRLIIKSKLKKDGLQLSVIDDGAGVHNSIKEGVGIRNIRNRLATIYQGKSFFSLTNNEPKGAESFILIPLSF
jgi:two-component system, LytTR family, sensor kinase